MAGGRGKKKARNVFQETNEGRERINERRDKINREEGPRGGRGENRKARLLENGTEFETRWND